MALSLDKIRQNLINQQERKSSNFSSDDKAQYRHWDMQVDETATVRFLPDGDESNQDSFWRNRFVFNWTFPGIKGDPDPKPITVYSIPCMQTFGEQCPILAQIRPLYKDEKMWDAYGGKDEWAQHVSKWWMKKSYLFQGFVRKNPLEGIEEAPENPIRRFNISPQIFKTISASLTNGDILTLPCDYEQGLDFNIRKTHNGKYAQYNTSNWSMSGPSPLTAEELGAIETYGLQHLNKYLPKKPTDDELQVIKEMFKASFEEEPFDMERWGSYYKPRGGQDSSDTTTSTVNTSEIDFREPKPEHAEIVAKLNAPGEVDHEAETPSTSSEDRAAEILARLKKS